MSIRGERFVVDFADHDGDSSQRHGQSASGAANPPSLGFVKDIVEREPLTATPPLAPTPKASATGFPEHKKRSRASAFRQQRGGAVVSNLPRDSADPPTRSPLHSPPTNRSSLTLNDGSFDLERRRVDEENRRRLAEMSPDEIEQERQELLSSLSPSLIENLLKRANLDEGRGDTGIDDESQDVRADESVEEASAAHAESPTATVIPTPSVKRVSASRTVTFDDDAEPADPGRLQPVLKFSREAAEIAGPSIHFPQASPTPDLDPSDPSFLEALHEKYFPSLSADPTKLAWMAPIPTHGSIADQDSPYYPGQETLPASALRFDFRGGLLPPRIARAVPVTKGLHHHGEAPEAAGYTIPELARLARSAFPAQRCIAFQTLGRFLYRLGRGEWGDGSEISEGLWRCVDEGKVVETLEQAAHTEGGHQGSKVYAIEAVWLWHKGGGKKWKAS